MTTKRRNYANWTNTSTTFGLPCSIVKDAKELCRGSTHALNAPSTYSRRASLSGVKCKMENICTTGRKSDRIHAVTVALMRRWIWSMWFLKLTAAVQFAVLLHTQALNSKKLGMWAFTKTALCMSLFSNTVMLTTHPVRKYSSFPGCEAIPLFLLLSSLLPNKPRESLKKDKTHNIDVVWALGLLLRHDIKCFLVENRTQYASSTTDSEKKQDFLSPLSFFSSLTPKHIFHSACNWLAVSLSYCTTFTVQGLLKSLIVLRWALCRLRK